MNQIPPISQFNSIIVEIKKPARKYSPLITEYNINCNSDNKEDIEFVDVDLSYNKLNVQLLTNDFNTYLKKRCVIVNTNDKIEEISKLKTN